MKWFVGFALAGLILPTCAMADFDCKLYSGPLPAKQITSDGTLNEWLKDSHATDPNGSLKLLGSFVDSSGSLVFRYQSGSSDTPIEYQFNIPVPTSTDGKCEQPSTFFKDVQHQYSCYDGGKWSSSLWVTRNAQLPAGMAENTQVYSLSANPMDPAGARNALLFGGKDCGKLASDSAWFIGSNCDPKDCKPNAIAPFYRKLINAQNPPGSLDFSQGAFPYPVTRPEDGPGSGGAAGMQSGGGDK
jgi:hypothetical protein